MGSSVVGLLALISVAGCGYRAGSYSYSGREAEGVRLAGGCLDVAVAVHPHSTTTRPVLTYALGNRCDRAVAVDLRRATVWGITAGGERIALRVRDPRGELGARRLAAAWFARLALAYDAPGSVDRVCVEVTGIADALAGEACVAAEGAS